MYEKRTFEQIDHAIQFLNSNHILPNQIIYFQKIGNGYIIIYYNERN